MAKLSDLPFLAINRNDAVPIYLQLENGIRQAVLSGDLAAGIKLPASRQLAEYLGVSRLPVQNAYEQLVAEGFLESRQGAGTFVSEVAVENLYPETPDGNSQPRITHQRLSERSRHITKTDATMRLEGIRPFRPGVPATDLFPQKAWAQSVRKASKAVLPDGFGYSEMAGSIALREEIARHIRSARGVKCDTDQIIITSGAQQAFTLIAFALLDPGVPVWLEDPGHIAVRDAMTAMNTQVYPVPLDDQGLDVAQGERRYATPKLIFITPSHQHPMGVTMSLRRRIELLNYAHKNDVWVVEDDYDSEFRYKGRPLTSLQGMDQQQVVIYVGSFSKTLFPGLRLGYIVAPPDLVPVIHAAQGILTLGCGTVLQEAVADFMALGHYETHIHRMRQAYKERGRALVKVLREKAGDHLGVTEPDAGMHLLAYLKRANPETVCKALWREGIDVLPLSMYSIRANVPPALVLGFACANLEEIVMLGSKVAEVVVRNSRGV